MIYSSHEYDRERREQSPRERRSGEPREFLVRKFCSERETRVSENVGMEITSVSRKRLLVGSNRELGRLRPRASLRSESYLLQASPFKNNHTFSLSSVTRAAIYW